MKNIIIAALAVCTFSACDDFLDEKLKGDFNSDNIFSNATQALLHRFVEIRRCRI